VLPARIGEVARGYMLSKRTGISFTYALTTVLVDRFFDLVGLLIITLIALRFLPKHSLPYMIWFGIYMLLILLVACIILLIVLSREKFAFKISRLLTGINRPFISQLAKRVLEIQENLNRINSPANLVYFILIAVTMWLLMSTALYFTMLMLSIKIGFIVAVFICALINMSLIIPSSPGYVGYYQGAFCLLLPIFGITKDEALTTSLVFQATWYIPYTILGGMLSIKEHLKIKDIQKLEEKTDA